MLGYSPVEGVGSLRCSVLVSVMDWGMGFGTALSEPCACEMWVGICEMRASVTRKSILRTT